MDIEVKAKEMGWVPQEYFKGDPEKFVDAETFVQRGEQFMPILRKNNEKLQARVDGLGAEVRTLHQTISAANEAMAALKEYQNDISKREYNKALKDLQDKRVEAKEAGDVRAELEAQDALEELKKVAPKAEEKKETPAAPAAPAIHPDFAAWEQDNQAWLADPEKRAYSQGVATYLRAAGRQEVGRAFLDLITAEVESRFGGKPSGKNVEGGGQPASRGGKSYADLPADAKAACDKFADKLVGPAKAYKTKEEWRKQYVANYDWS